MARSEYEKLDQAEEDDNEYESGEDETARTSEDVRRRDRSTLEGEEEAERLLTGSASRSNEGDEKRSRRSKSSKKRRKDAEKREVVYEMEEGGPRSSSAESSGHSTEVDLAKLSETQAMRQSKKRQKVHKYVAIYAVIICAFLVLLYGAWRASKGSHSAENNSVPETVSAENSIPSHQEDKEPVQEGTMYRPQALSNGTHTFAPTTIILSLDGFRADFLHRNLSPTLSRFIKEGVSPKYMLPSFPSLTFPNHFTLVTGLHPESHGIVGNTFYDPETQQEFYYTDPARSMQDHWWNAEPIWVTAEKAGVKTGVHMWPGSEVRGGIGGVQASYVDQFNGDEKLENKVARILGWLDLPEADPGANLDNDRVQEKSRPQLIAAYVPDVDADGHLYGPNSTYIRSTIAEVDGMLGLLLEGLDERNLTDIVNIIVVSDHGMATTSTNRLIQLEDLIGTSLIEHTDGWPLYGLRPYDTSEENLQELYQKLVKESKESKYKHAFDVYLRDGDSTTKMPERYHFAQNQRIAPLWIVPKTGWAIVTKDEFDVAPAVANGETYHPRGLHGYDNQHPLMRAIFVARGPAFPHVPGSELEPFQNTEVYNILCDSLGIEPVANNGTLRLPLKPKGMYDFDQVPEIPEDLQDDESLALPPEVPNLAYGPTGQAQEPPKTMPPEVPNLANRPDFVVPTAGVPPVSPTPAAVGPEEDDFTTPEQVGQPNKPVDGDTEAEEGGDGDEKKTGWWSWLTGKADAAKGWAYGLFHGKDGDGEADEG